MPDIIDPDDWVFDPAAAFRRAYASYRRMADLVESEIRKRLPCWQVEVREHRKDSFEVLICPPLKDSGAAKVFYLNNCQIGQILDPDFNASPTDFFGFNLYEDEDFKA